jgi:hypothetical protein
MFTPKQIETVYEFMSVFENNPRISFKKLHRDYSNYRAESATADLLRRAKAHQILLGPRIYVNAGTDVEIIKLEDLDEEDLCEKWETIKSNSKVTYATMLCGGHRFIIFKRGATVLTYAESIKPSYPGKKQIEEISPTKKGKLSIDPYPKRWDELDWKIYRLMGNPRVSFVDVGKKLEISWQTVKNHYLKIIKDCRVWQSFFPKGLSNYYHLYSTFETDYEVGLRNELKNIDRTTYLFKFENTVIMYACLDNERAFCRRLLKMEKEGIVRNLRVSIPMKWYRPGILY